MEGNELLNKVGDHVGTYWRDGVLPKNYAKAHDIGYAYESVPTRVWPRLRVGDFACVGAARYQQPLQYANGAPDESAMVGIVLDIIDDFDSASETDGVTRYVLVHCVQNGGIYLADATALCVLETVCGLEHWRPVAARAPVYTLEDRAADIAREVARVMDEVGRESEGVQS
jgi:hypothetical protein